MSFPKYGEYKQSALDWLGTVPKHWRIEPYKRLVDIQNGSDHKHIEQDEGYPVIGSGGTFTYASEYIYDGESVLLGRKGTIDKPLYVNGKFWTVDTMYWTKVSPNANGRFAYYTALTIPFELYSTSTALPSMTKSALSAHRVAVPTIDEQTAIANFLDAETAKIDGLVAEQRRLIELLKEKRQAVISHAVTKGLNPNAPMKDSGIEWLGYVPEHWEVSKIKYECQYESGHTPSKSNEKLWVEEECHIPWVSLNDTKTIDAADFIDDTATKISEVGMANSSAHLIDAGAVVFTRDGARVGLSAITTKPMCVSQHIIAWVCGPRVSNHFLLHVIYAMNAEIYRITAGSTIPTIGMPDVKRMNMPLPTLDEQLAIVEFLVNERERFATLIVDAERAIELLQERRTALISATVTGKIDVREFESKEAVA